MCWAFDPSRVPVRLVAPRAVAFLPTACLRSALPRFTFFSERSTCTSRVIDPAHTALVLIVSLTQVLVRSRARHCHPGACYRTHCLRTAWIGPFLSNAVPVLLCVRAMSRSFIFPSPERRSPASLPFFFALAFPQAFQGRCQHAGCTCVLSFTGMHSGGSGHRKRSAQASKGIICPRCQAPQCFNPIPGNKLVKGVLVSGPRARKSGSGSGRRRVVTYECVIPDGGDEPVPGMNATRNFTPSLFPLQLLC